MPNISANKIRIEYDTFGEPSCLPVLLIMGLASQMIDWDEEFCSQLAGKGFYVIRFDNRDVGLSTKFDEAGISGLKGIKKGDDTKVPYTLDDMADDAAGLLDALGIEKAHICGISMGAMMAQIMGYRHPEKVLSLTLIMGSTGASGLPKAKPEALEILFAPAPRDKEVYIEYAVTMWRILWGPLDFDEELVRKKAAASYDRGLYPQGFIRQNAAIVASGDRRDRLGSITTPTLVIHGSEDPLLPIEHGKDIAEAIPGAEMLIIEGMGHCLARATWTLIIDAIVNHINKPNI